MSQRERHSFKRNWLNGIDVGIKFGFGIMFMQTFMKIAWKKNILKLDSIRWWIKSGFATAVEWNLYASVNLCVTDWIFWLVFWLKANRDFFFNHNTHENRMNGTTILKTSAFYGETKLGGCTQHQQKKRWAGDKRENHVCRKWNYKTVWLKGICIRIIFYSAI